MDAINISAYVDTKTLAAATAETITKPAGKSACIITADARCAIRRGGTAVAPAADVSDGTGSQWIPADTPVYLDLADTHSSVLASFSIISTPGANVSIAWF